MRVVLCAGAAAAALLFASEAAADDSSAALGMGGLVFTQSADIRMADEDLRISPKEVRIRFAFANDGAHDIDTIMAFPLPDIDTAEFSNSAIGTVTGDPVNFVGFKVTADGRPVAVSVEQRAFFNGRDVTATVRSVGLPVNVISDQGYKLLVALSPEKRKLLTSAGLAEFDEYNNALPRWIVRTKFFWHQHFPAGKTVVLEQRYQPVTGQFFFGSYDLKPEAADGQTLLKSYCTDPGSKATLEKMIAAKEKADPQGGGYLNAYETDYILMTGNNWKGPIGRFHLTLDKLKPDNVLSLCWDGTLEKTGPTTFEDTRERFAPRADIKMLVLDAAPPG